LGPSRRLPTPNDANLQNLIHYSSYQADELERTWRAAGEKLVGPLPALAEAPPNLARVGAPHGFDVGKLNDYFQQIRDGFNVRVQESDWSAVFNRMTLQTALWLALATAGRKTKTPIPRIIVAGEWAFVDDKHLSDGSTDRLVPLSAGVVAQLRAWLDLADHLSITHPTLDPYEVADDGTTVRLHYVDRDGLARPYQPKIQEGELSLTPLPGNWARKLVRSESKALFGRMVDAGCGHAVRGRHPWRLTSTMATQEFQANWLKLQDNLENRLGLQVLKVPGLPRSRRDAAPALPTRENPKPPASDPAPEVAAVELSIDEMLRQTDPALHAQIFETDHPEGVAALELVRQFLVRQKTKDPQSLSNLADAACTHIRLKTKIPLFSTRPRPQFSRDWMIDGDALQTLAWIERHALPAFRKDLARLPPLPSDKKNESPAEGDELAEVATPNEESAALESIDPARQVNAAVLTADVNAGGLSPEEGERIEKKRIKDAERKEKADRLAEARQRKSQDQIELGRLLMIVTWRIGLTRIPMAEPLLRWLAGDRPILATGRLRYLCLQVPCRRGGDLMRRTVFLDDFTASYLLIERERLRAILTRHFAEQHSRVRSASLQRALIQYLISIGVPAKGIRLAAMMAAAVQRFMIRGSPILAAYSCGEFVTMDLDDLELRRLADLEPIRASQSAAVRDRNSNLDDEEDWESDLEDGKGIGSRLPSDLRRHDRNFVHSLTAKKTPFFHVLVSEVGAVQPVTSLQRLLKSFALWLLLASEEQNAAAAHASGGKQSPKSQPKPKSKDWNKKPRIKKQWAARVTVIGHALIGLAGIEDTARTLDGAMLERLEEECREYFLERLVRGAWRQFRAFLRDEIADHAGFTISNLPNNNERDVSARIMRADHIEQCLAQMASSLSGIGNAAFRYSACRLMGLASDIGARRGELEKLRTVDSQGDLLRIQPHGSHTLKTAWSERVVPIEFLSDQTRDNLARAEKLGVTNLIDPEPGVTADGNNFFNAMNGVIKRIAKDENLGIHHLRHTLASRMLLSVLREAVDLDVLFEDMPWIEPLLIDRARLALLAGDEGPSGQGLQVTSAMLGHGHPTTTLRHYTHSVAIAFFALTRNLDPIDVTVSFENRLSSVTTVQRWATEVRREHAKSPNPENARHVINRAFRMRVERHGRLSEGIDIDERRATRSPTSPWVDTRSDDPMALIFDRIDALDRELRGEGVGSVGAWLEDARRGLSGLAVIPSGKKGSDMGRHPLVQNHLGNWLPDRLDAGSATQTATTLLGWLENLRIQMPDDFVWLIKKWVNASERERGRMRLDGDSDLAAASRLPSTASVSAEIEPAKMSKGRSGKIVYRLRLRFPGSGVYDRDIGAVRWVMAWVAAINWSANGAESVL
jgi:integrase